MSARLTAIGLHRVIDPPACCHHGHPVHMADVATDYRDVAVQ
jgi:hypothetical protein